MRLRSTSINSTTDMATLAEIMARKAAGAKAPAAQSGETKGTVIRAEDERAKMAADIKRTLDACSPKVRPPADRPQEKRRELGAMEPGERLPMDHPKQGAPDADWDFFNCQHSFESDLGIVIEPDGRGAWLAVTAMPSQPPLLLMRLPLLNRPQENQPF